MRVRVSIVMTLAVVVAAVSACVGQSPPPPDEQGAEYRAPRTAEGRPDLKDLASAEHGKLRPRGALRAAGSPKCYRPRRGPNLLASGAPHGSSCRCKS